MWQKIHKVIYKLHKHNVAYSLNIKHFNRGSVWPVFCRIFLDVLFNRKTDMEKWKRQSHIIPVIARTRRVRGNLMTKGGIASLRSQWQLLCLFFGFKKNHLTVKGLCVYTLQIIAWQEKSFKKNAWQRQALYLQFMRNKDVIHNDGSLQQFVIVRLDRTIQCLWIPRSSRGMTCLFLFMMLCIIAMRSQIIVMSYHW